MKEKRRRFRRPSPEPHTTVTFSVRMDHGLVDQIDARAGVEQRSRAAMVEILVAEALRARREKEADDVRHTKPSKPSFGE